MRQSGHLQPVPSRDGSGPKTFGQLPTQTQSFRAARLNVRIRRKPPCSFRDHALVTRMTADGWVAAVTVNYQPVDDPRLPYRP